MKSVMVLASLLTADEPLGNDAGDTEGQHSGYNDDQQNNEDIILDGIPTGHDVDRGSDEKNRQEGYQEAACIPDFFQRKNFCGQGDEHQYVDGGGNGIGNEKTAEFSQAGEKNDPENLADKFHEKTPF